MADLAQLDRGEKLVQLVLQDNLGLQDLVDHKDPVASRDNQASVAIVERQVNLVHLVHLDQEERLDQVGSQVLMDHQEQPVSFST